MPYNTAEFRLFLEQYLEIEVGIDLVLDKSPAVHLWKSRSKLVLMCRTCKWTGDTTALTMLQSGRGMGCLCNGSHNSLASKQYYERCIKSPYTDQDGKRWYRAFHDGEVETPTFDVWEAAARKGNTATIPLTCCACKWTGDTAALATLQRGHGVGCKCTGRKTERLLLNWLELHFCNQVWDYNTLRDCINPETSKSLPFDFACKASKIIVELDGPQHFVPINFGSSQSKAETDEAHQKLAARDLLKEQWATKHGWLLLRVLQEDVWKDPNIIEDCVSSPREWTTPAEGWGAFLKTQIDARLVEQHPDGSIVCQPNATEYTAMAGAYSQARQNVRSDPTQAIRSSSNSKASKRM